MTAPLPWEEPAAPVAPTDAPVSGLKAAVIKLAVLRAEAAQRDANLKAKRTAFEATLADERAQLEATKRAIEAADSEVRALAEIEADRTGNMAPCPGITVVRTTDYALTDRDKAFAWSKASGIGYVPESFDEKTVLGAIKKAGLAVDFVATELGFATRIATDLLKALDMGTEAAA